jgi:two-component system LytT family response regulator
MIRVVIADDEVVARRRMSRLLASRRDVEVVAECSGGVAALDAIQAAKPDLVLLDVQMPDLDGFDVLRAVSIDPAPAVVFITAFDQYALRAFDAAAIDYILKPYSPDRFHQALDRAIRWIGSEDHNQQVLRLVTEIQASRNQAPQPAPGRIDRFMIKQRERVHFVRASDVDWIASEGNYVRLHVGSASHLVRATVASCEERLDPRQFVRTHRRFMVNIERVKEVQPWFAGDAVIILHNGQKVRLSRSYRETFQQRMLGGDGS